MDNLHEDDPARVDLQRYIEDALALLQNYMVRCIAIAKELAVNSAGPGGG